jgi:FkbH-like protein
MSLLDIKYSEILKGNKNLENVISDKEYSITILSNITTSQANEILEYRLRLDNIPAKVSSGSYDNIIQDSEKFRQSNVVIIFWEACNFVEGLHCDIEIFTEIELDEFEKRIKSEIDLVLKNLEKTSLVIINKFESFPLTNKYVFASKFDLLVERLNKYLDMIYFSNVKVVDINKIISRVGVEKAVDYRFYYSSKALYTIEFYRKYVEFIWPLIASANGKTKKALILDCDNTLWKGIVGEDGLEGIEMSSTNKDGAIFSEVQALIKWLSRQGVLIGLCSKNNNKDVEEVLENHADMNLRNEDIAIKKINWNDKANNIREISEELNIGLDSIVYVDDSEFEINLIRNKLPEITVIEVPKDISGYPEKMREHIGLFYNLSTSDEDKRKTEIYKQREIRNTARNQFIDIEDYLRSLKIKIVINFNNESIIPRVAQMTQKTNQFNLTTKRYTEADIKNILDDSAYMVFSLSVSDMYGDSGVTGLSIMHTDKDNKIAEIDSFLMSCRILGRNIEYAFIDAVIEKLKSQNINGVKAKYIKTKKNDVSEMFYDEIGFDIQKTSDDEKVYELKLSEYTSFKPDYIDVKYV